MSDSHVSGPLNVTDALVVAGTAHFTGGVNLAGGGTVTGTLVASALSASGTVGGTASVVAFAGGTLGATSGAGTITGLLNAGNLHSGGTIGVVGNATLAGTALTLGTQVWSYGTANPGAGGVIGNIRWNTAPAAEGEIGWVCTAPGTWKAFGTIAA